MNAAPNEWVTSDLRLRPFRLDDAERFQSLANDQKIAGNVRSLEYPMPPGAGREWIEKHLQWERQGQTVVRAICQRQLPKQHRQQLDPSLAVEDPMLGVVGLAIDRDQQQAELGYWLGSAYWGHGWATQAAAAMVAYGFNVLKMQRVHAHHLVQNPASGRVLQKIGMRQEGVLRAFECKPGRSDDVVLYSLLASDFFETEQIPPVDAANH